MTPRFFIDRPIFATVLSLLVTLAGVVSLRSLSVAQYPDIAPPTIQIDCNYPGASAAVVAQSIAAPIEQFVNGVEDMLYMTSQCTSDGSYTCTITFRSGADLDMAQVRVQNRVNLALPLLPEVVRATGVTTRKRSPELLMTVGITSTPEPGFPNGRYDQLYLSNYALLRLREELQRLPGISDITIFGQRDYAMRVWLDPDRLAALNLTAQDVVNAIRDQNLPLPAGRIGQPPINAGQAHQLTLSGVGRLTEPEEFARIVIKSGDRGQLVRVRDVGRVELGAKAQDIANRFDDRPTVGLAVFVLPDCNALETRDAVVRTMERLAKDIPPGITYEIGYDTTPFIRESIDEVFWSLRDAVVLVSVVVWLFLQSWRAAVIPLAAVPVAIIGTFAAMAAVGFSLNLLTLFGLILAVGIVVDDAIVVVEAVQHQIEKGLPPREATIRAMEEVTGPIFAVGVVLSFVFFPCVFISGIVGAFFKQFALTIAASTVISTFNSLTLSPALCALLLRPRGAGPRSRCGRLLSRLLLPFSLLGRGFDRLFNRSGRLYVKIVGFSLRVPVLVLGGYLVVVAAGVLGLRSLPNGFIPQQDKGYLVCSIQLPDAASAERTREVISRISRIALDLTVDLPADPGEPGAEWVADGDGSGRWVKRVRPVKHVNAIAGNSFVLSAYGSNFGSMFVILDDFRNRRDPRLSADAVAGELRGRFAALCPEAEINVFGAPAVPRLGRAGGFRIMIEDRGDVGPEVLEAQTRNLISIANQQPQLVGLFTVFKTDSPQIYLAVDRGACVARGLELADVYATLQATMGSRYANDFNNFGRTWQVNVQAEMPFRDRPDDVKKLKVRNRAGEMVPLGAVLAVREEKGPLVITRYNMYPAAAVNGNFSPGTSTGDGIALLEKLAERELPSRLSYEWTELMFLEKQSRDTAAWVFGLSVVFVFLVLAALYESWVLPLAVILVVPVCVACSLAAVWVTDPLSAAESLIEWNRWVTSLNGPNWMHFNGSAVEFARQLDSGPITTLHRWISSLGIAKQDVNVFTQIGFVVLIGLACKNAILIVEFAKVARDTGTDVRSAVVEACRLRYRPIIMTSIAFMSGVLPLAVARGAGWEMRQAIGVAVLGGMLGVTVFGIVLTPVFFALLDRLTRTRLASHPWIVRASTLGLYVVGFRFLRPVALALKKAAVAASDRLRRKVRTPAR